MAAIALIVGAVIKAATDDQEKAGGGRTVQSQNQPPTGAAKWYSGGDLHAKTMREWKAATYANRLATSSDIVTKIMQIEGRHIPPVDTLKPKAAEMEQCISAAGTDASTDVRSVSEFGALCGVMLK